MFLFIFDPTDMNEKTDLRISVVTAIEHYTPQG